MSFRSAPGAPGSKLHEEIITCDYYNQDVDVFGASLPSVDDSCARAHVNSPHNDEMSVDTSLSPGKHKTESEPYPSQTLDTPWHTTVHKKFEGVKSWSLNTLKCTKQLIEEKLGTTVPTCDKRLDLRIETLKQMQRQYKLLLNNLRQFSVNFSRTMEVQRHLTVQLASLGQQQLELTEPFTRNSETHRSLVLNGEKLLVVLDVVCKSLSTLVRHTFDDTMQTIKSMNTARIEYDATRKEYETLHSTSTKLKQTGSTVDHRLDEVFARLRLSEQNFAALKSAVDTKLRLLHENRVRVMQHNLLLLHCSTIAYFSGDGRKLDETMRQFNIRTLSPGWTESTHSECARTPPIDPKSPSVFEDSSKKEIEQVSLKATANGIH